MGTGEPITFSTKNGISTESWRTVGNCQFYYEDDGSLAFRLKNECPDTFSTPSAYYMFDSWEGNEGYNKLSAAETTFTALWCLDPSTANGSYVFSPTEYTLPGPGYTDIECRLESIEFMVRLNNKGEIERPDCLEMYSYAGTLEDGNGHNIPFLVDDASHSQPGEHVDIYRAVEETGDIFPLPIWIDPEVYDAAEPGTYTGTLTYEGRWETWGIFGEQLTIALTLVVPEHPHIIKTDGAALAYYYNDSFEQIFPTEAEEGTELSLWIREDAEPEEGNYFTGEFTVNGVSLGRKYNVYNPLISWPVTGFTMPREDVTIGAVQAAREAMALSFAPNQTLALPRDAWMQIQFVEGEPPLIWYDEATATQALDVNRDRKPDLLIAFDDEAYCVNLTRLPACAAFGEFAFAFSGPTDRYGTVAFVIPKPSFGPAAFTLPADLATIGESAFEGMTAMTVVDAGHVTAIGANAFRGCTALTQLRLPAACTIDVTAFTGCDTVFIFAPAGGTTEANCAAIANVVFVPAD